MDKHTTLLNNKTPNLYTLIWLGCHTFPRDEPPVAGMVTEPIDVKKKVGKN